MKQPGFIEVLRKEISRNCDSIRQLVNRKGGLQEEELFSLLCFPKDTNHQFVEVAKDTNVSFYHDDLEGYESLGSQQSFVHCIYAGDVEPTTGEPKALMRVPGLGISLLAIKLLQTPRGCQTWVVTPPHFKERIAGHLSMLCGFDLGNILLIEQDSVYMLTPDYRLIKDELSPCGTGGVVSSLLRGDHYNNFVQDGGKYVYVTDVSNVLATPSLEILGHHVKHNSKVTFEVVRRIEEEARNLLVNTEHGVNLVDQSRLLDFDTSAHLWGGTGSVILSTDLDLEAALPPWRRVRSTYKNYLTVRYQRFLEELSEAYTSSFVGVARDERFFWVDSLKDLEEISRRVTIKFAV